MAKIKLSCLNPYVRAAMVQPAVLEGSGMRVAYDNRLFCILDGNGAFLTSDREIPVEPYTVLLIPPGTGYDFRGKMRVIVLNFDLTRAAEGLKKPICPPPQAQFDSRKIFDPTAAEGFEGLCVFNGALVKDDLFAIVDEFDPEDTLADALTSSLLKKIYVTFALNSESSEDNTDALVKRVCRYIRLYAPQIRDNESLAKQFGYHPVYLEAVFRERAGESLHKAILRERIQLAQKLLICSDEPVDDIARSAGFATPSHFSATFRKYTGLSPREYRNRRTPASGR
ncbi:MAG: AraC family transcriptional regulator [Clostridiales bacterium]|nr:AraC family transcriptional regulator [Clostridiales bacterium]